jgi:FdhD protein
MANVQNTVLDRSQWKVNVEMDGDALGEELLFKRIYTSGCGKGIIYYNPLDFIQRDEVDSSMQIEAATIMELMRRFLKSSREYKQTRGVHSAALVTGGEIVLVMDDIGRHNAIDKIVGQALIRRIELEDSVVLTSGRISSEIVSKILRCRIPVLVAAGAPTDQAVKIALAADLTLVGRARGGRLVIYSGAARIV